MRTLLSLALAAGIICSAAAQVSSSDPSALWGLDTLHLAAGDITLAGGVSADGLLEIIRDEVQARGIELSSQEGIPDLTLEMHLIQNAADGLVVGRIALSLTQQANVIREEGATPIPIRAETWESHSLIMASPSADTLQILVNSTVENLAQQFTADHRAVNGASLAASEDHSLLYWAWPLNWFR